MFFHSEIDRKRQTEKDRHKHKHKKLYFLQHSTVEILHTCMHNTKTNQVMKIMKSTKYCLILILKVRSDIGLCNAAGRLFHNVPPLNWTAPRPYDEATENKCNVFLFLVL